MHEPSPSNPWSTIRLAIARYRNRDIGFLTLKLALEHAYLTASDPVPREILIAWRWQWEVIQSLESDFGDFVPRPLVEELLGDVDALAAAVLEDRSHAAPHAGRADVLH